MKWPHGNSGATYLRYVIDTVQTLQYSDSQCVHSKGVHTAVPETAPNKPIDRIEGICRSHRIQPFQPFHQIHRIC